MKRSARLERAAGILTSPNFVIANLPDLLKIYAARVFFLHPPAKTKHEKSISLLAPAGGRFALAITLLAGCATKGDAVRACTLNNNQIEN